ncbi:MAG TPA: YcaO-like family protein [Candidatus Baltobacteraceae bacterium]|nr:YcaO-like family protein [Candidatus Baltobacteraceae bacterium]
MDDLFCPPGRMKPLAATLQSASVLQTQYGITRIADITHLDRIGIPVINVIVPDSPDIIGVYNGKGITKEHAVASGLMEALERQICARCDVDRAFVPVAEMHEYLDLPALGWIGPGAGGIECVRGVDLLGGAKIAVPLGLVQCPRTGHQHFTNVSTNGLASGNTATEAVLHALLELCERHLWSRVHVLAHMWPRSLRARAGDLSERADDAIANEVIARADTPLIGAMAEKIRCAGLGFRLLCYVNGGWPIAMLACISEPHGREMFYHLGMGCSWSPLHAATRAITEAVQVRLGDISGAREDLRRASGAAEGFEHGRRPAGFPTGRWYFDGPARQIAFDDLPDRSRTDLGQEVAMILDVLRDFGERCVAYVDLSPKHAPGISVARVVAPSLERTLVDGSLSRRSSTLLSSPLTWIR